MFDAHKNFADSTVATPPSPATSGTTVVVAAGQGARFPAVPFNAAITPTSDRPSAANSEIVRVTAIATDTLTIVRAQEGSIARSVITGDRIFAGPTAKTLTDVEALTIVAANAPLKAVVTITAAQLKTVTASVSVPVLVGVPGKTIIQAGTIYARFTPGATAFGNIAANLQIFYENAFQQSDIKVSEFTVPNVLDQTADIIDQLSFYIEGGISVGGLVGKGLVLSLNQGTVLTLGDGTLTITIFYYLV